MLARPSSLIGAFFVKVPLKASSAIVLLFFKKKHILYLSPSARYNLIFYSHCYISYTFHTSENNGREVSGNSIHGRLTRAITKSVFHSDFLVHIIHENLQRNVFT